MPEVVLAVDGLAKRFEDVQAVRGVSFEVRAGELFVLLGPNGAGKTTTIRLICGLLTPDAGRVLVRGQPLAGSAEGRARVGLCPQELVLFEKLSCLEQLELVGELYGLSRSAARESGHHLHAYLGFPARTAVASIVHEGFKVLGNPSLTSQTVLQLETGAMNVDLPCSGIRSAWTGLVFFLGATCLLRSRLGLRWILAGAGYLLLLFAANILRVAALALHSHAGLPALSRLVHEPLGVPGFALAQAVAYALLRLLSRPGRPAAASPRPAPKWLAPALALALLALAFARPPVAPPAAAGALAEMAFPAGLATTPLPLSEAERDLFSRHGARAQKVRLGGALPGTLIVVQARSCRTHHPPEQCLRGSGRTVESDLPLVLANGLPVRLIRLAGGGVAIWWFHSPSGSVNDLLQRLGAEVSGRESRWALVSLVLDALPPDGQGLESLTTTLSEAVAAFFARTPCPSGPGGRTRHAAARVRRNRSL